MKIIKATTADCEAVIKITRDTINAIYPHYYPSGAVDFFLAHHSDQNILTDIESGIVYLLSDENGAEGTVTIKKNEICRLFVLPQYQGKGYGRELLDFSEEIIKESYSEVTLSASPPAKAIYEKRGYKQTEYHQIKTRNADFLCYDIMVKNCNFK